MIKLVRGQKKLEYYLLVVLWLTTIVFFWKWWLEPNHIGDSPILFVMVSLAFFYVSTILPSFYLFFLGQISKPSVVNPTFSLKSGIVTRVALIKLMVPGSESLDLLIPQLEAMARVKKATERHGFSVDLWLLVDKKHVSEIQALAEEFGVMYFCRHDQSVWGEEQVSNWNQSVPPFKANTKAGNVNAWLYTYGTYYSHFTQLDFDHVPNENYLLHTLGYFYDPNVKWVQGPSLYSNHDSSWCARGASEQELVLQGPLQMGFYGFSKTPMIIGSHCTYDTNAIFEIGGFQPTRAEDHLDTVFLASKGYQGVYVPKTIAVGQGPETFETYCAQQFAWAYSMFQVLFQFTPKMVRTMKPKAAIQFLFAETWYLFMSLSYAILTLSIPASLVANTTISNVIYMDFIIHSIPLSIVAFLVWRWSKEWHKPHGLGLTWRGVVLHIARWPIILSALVQVILKIQKPYMITPKGINTDIAQPFYLKNFAIYFGIITILIASCWYFVSTAAKSATGGNMFYALWGALTFSEVYAVTLAMNIAEMRKRGVSTLQSLLYRAKALTMLFILIIVLAITTRISTIPIWNAITYNVISVQEKKETIHVQTSQDNIGSLSINTNHDGK